MFKIKMKIVLVGKKESFFDEIPVSKEVYKYKKERMSRQSDKKLDDEFLKQVQKIYPNLFYACELEVVK